MSFDKHYLLYLLLVVIVYPHNIISYMFQQPDNNLIIYSMVM